MKRPLGLVADDFALTKAVSRGILRLADAGRLSGTGAMTNRPAWTEGAAALAQLGDAIDAGLHLNLTLGSPLGAMPKLAPTGQLPPLGSLVRALALPGAPLDEVEAEIGRQIDAFADRLGRWPDFIDGHQHVHVLPRVRGALFSALARRFQGAGPRPWLRDPFDTPGRIIARGVAVGKAQVVAGLATGFGRSARRRGFATNHGFSGFSAFAPEDDYGEEFRRSLLAPGRLHLVMCHPGDADDPELPGLDPVVDTRPRELAYLASRQFADDLEEAGYALARLGLAGD
jgi:predicted glycoside hydrolase/deacetylase ChbG (UPF0249 family)